MSAITISNDLRSRFGSARDQGARPTCLAFAMSDAHAAIRIQPWEALSCEYLFYHAKQRDGTPVSVGTTVPAIRVALDQDGQPIESSWPYLKALPTNLATWKPPSSAVTLYQRKSTVSAKPFDQVWQEVENGRPVVLGMTLSTAFYTPDVAGLIDVVEPPDPAIRHAVVAVATGYLGSQRVILIRNSWGGTWGLSGYAWLSERYVADKISSTITLI